MFSPYSPTVLAKDSRCPSSCGNPRSCSPQRPSRPNDCSLFREQKNRQYDFKVHNFHSKIQTLSFGAKLLDNQVGAFYLIGVTEESLGVSLTQLSTGWLCALLQSRIFRKRESMGSRRRWCVTFLFKLTNVWKRAMIVSLTRCSGSVNSRSVCSWTKAQWIQKGGLCVWTKSLRLITSPSCINSLAESSVNMNSNSS